MSNASARWHDLDRLLDRVLDGLHSEEDSRQLNEILRTGVEACRRYVAYMELHGRLTWGDGIRAGSERGTSDEGLVGDGRGMVGLPTIDVSVGAAVQHPVGAAVQLPHQPESRTPNPESPVFPFPSLSTTHYPLPTSDFVGSWSFACMVATVIVGAMLLGFWAIKVTHHQHIAEAPSKSVPSDARPEFVFVGRITGAADVKWSDDPNYLPPLGFGAVPLGRKYKLDA
ncbi:MAG: hypothetical protein KKA28_10100, partial [Planctomycetes bacterium]|nr:hypothetical protein [Planctomycetota bacterium]